MYYQTKVYFDGSHYIGIPKSKDEKPYRPKRKPSEEDYVEVIDEENEQSEEKSVPTESVDTLLSRAENLEPTIDIWDALDENGNVRTDYPCQGKAAKSESKKVKKKTRKDIFNELYDKYVNLKKKERKEVIIQEMSQYFDNLEDTVGFVERQFYRKRRNLIIRRIRLTRKVNLQQFNYFCTFTYDGKKHDEESFKKKLKTTFRNLCFRKGWKYVGVWERSPEKHRLHFHGMFYIPEGGMPGELIEKEDYNTTKRKMQKTIQNTYFNERFGRTDFEPIDDRSSLGEATAYIMKYIEKTGERVVYSKGLPQFFVADIKEEDVILKMGMSGEKLLLFDNFRCYNEGKLVGIVSAEVIKRLPSLP